jgi:hypothetical protein
MFDLRAECEYAALRVELISLIITPRERRHDPSAATCRTLDSPPELGESRWLLVLRKET